MSKKVEPPGLESAVPLSTVFRGTESRPKHLTSPDRSRGRCSVGVKFLLLGFILTLFLPLSRVFSLPARDVKMIPPREYYKTLCSLINQASKSIWIVMYSFKYYSEYPLSPSNLILQELLKAKKRGVEIKVLLDISDWNEKNSRENQQTGRILSRNGIKVYYDKMEVNTHAKTIVIDSRYTVVGSTNWTYYALTSNNEISVLIDSEELAKETETYIMGLIKNSGK